MPPVIIMTLEVEPLPARREDALPEKRVPVALEVGLMEKESV